MYATINVTSEKGREEIKSWNDVNECLMEIERRSRIVLIEYMNGRVGNSEVAGVVTLYFIMPTFNNFGTFASLRGSIKQ